MCLQRDRVGNNNSIAAHPSERIPQTGGYMGRGCRRRDCRDGGPRHAAREWCLKQSFKQLDRVTLFKRK